MSKEVARRELPAKPRFRLGRNYITFPRELRDAIPDLPTYVGRSLELSEMHGESSATALFGKRIHLRLTASETGKLKGRYPIRVDLDPEAARGLAATLIQLADELDR